MIAAASLGLWAVLTRPFDMFGISLRVWAVFDLTSETAK
jgi:hypothetical protein